MALPARSRPGAGRSAEEPPRPWFLPTVAGPSALAPAPPRTSRTPGRRPRMVWPVGSHHPFGSDPCSSCSGSSAGAQSCGCRGRWVGGWAGGGSSRFSAGCRAPGSCGGKPRCAGAVEGPSAARRRGPGLGFPYPGEYLLPRSSLTPFPCPHAPEVSAPARTVTAPGTLAPARAAARGAAAVGANDSAPFAP